MNGVTPAADPNFFPPISIKFTKGRSKSKIKPTDLRPPMETLAYRYYRDGFELFITMPRPDGENFFFRPKFAAPMLKNALGPDYDNEWDSDNLWDWRTIKKPTAEKTIGQKVRGSKDVLHIWGYYYGKKLNPYRNLTKHLPFRAEAVMVSNDLPISIRRVYTGQ
jgi:hypothetical protein